MRNKNKIVQILVISTTDTLGSRDNTVTGDSLVGTYTLNLEYDTALSFLKNIQT